MNIGRCRRAFSARSTAPRPMIGSELAVHETTMSNSAAAPAGRPARIACGAEARRQLLAALAACGWRRAIGCGWRAAKWVAASSIISPAPTNSTAGLAQVFEQLRGQPHRRGRHADRVRADLGRGAHFLGDRERALEHLVQRACRACPRSSASRTACFIWPRICGSPSTIESRPAGDAKRVARRRRGPRARRRASAAAGRLRRRPGRPASRAPGRTSVARRRAARRARCGCRSRRSRPRLDPARGARGTPAASARSCCGANAKRPRRSSGAVVWLSPRAKTLIGAIIKFGAVHRTCAAPSATPHGSDRRVLASAQLLRAGARRRRCIAAALTKLIWRRELGRRRLAPAGAWARGGGGGRLIGRAGRLRPRRPDGDLRGDGGRAARWRCGGPAFATPLTAPAPVRRRCRLRDSSPRSEWPQHLA